MSTVAATRPARPLPVGGRVAVVALLALAGVAGFLLIGAHGNLEFALRFRSRTLAALVLVGWATGVSSLVFHTVTGNRILTPSILGFDSLYALIQTALVMALGASASAVAPRWAVFATSALAMAALAVGLFAWLFVAGRRSVGLVLLVGIVLATGLRSATTLLQRIMDPNAFLVLQGNLFASFNGVPTELLVVGAVVIGACTVALFALRRQLDVLSLGRDMATALGIRYRRLVLLAVALCALMVATATAMVGPITFLGLLVANLAWLVAGTSRHGVVMPIAGTLGVLVLVGGQAVLQHVLGMATVLSVVIELVGGIVFIVLLLKGNLR